MTRRSASRFHALTGLGLVCEGEGDAAGGTTGQQQQQTKTDPPAYTPPASQAELDRIIRDRLARHKPDGYDDLVAKAARADALDLELGSTADKVAAKARAEAVAEATPRLVRAEFKAAAKGVLTAEQVGELLEDLDLSKYVNAKGEIDEAKVQRKVDVLAPKKDDQQQRRQQPSAGFGQGQHQPATISAKEMGAAEAAKRFGKKTA